MRSILWAHSLKIKTGLTRRSHPNFKFQICRLQILELVKTWTLILKTTWNEGARGGNITHATMCQTPPVSMKGEITGSKRHLKGHKSKLSFSRFDDPRVTSRLFPHSIVLPRNARWANHQVINCSSARPPGRKFGGKSGNFWARHWFLWSSEHAS